MAEWFWTRLAPPNDQGCREWTGARVSSPHAAVGAPKYGQTARGDGTTKRVLVHRYAWELTYGPIPDGMLVCHSCDNPPCCEPTHLFLGTPADNMRDKIQKGRARSK